MNNQNNNNNKEQCCFCKSYVSKYYLKKHKQTGKCAQKCYDLHLEEILSEEYRQWQREEEYLERLSEGMEEEY